jgi:fibronectin-binding autotransporter adhesin
MNARLCACPVGILFSLLLAPQVLAAPLTWDADTSTGGAQDGGGTWDNGNVNWWDGSNNTNWTGANPDDATFGSGGTAGTVSIGAPVSAGNITFASVATGEYTIAAGELTLVGSPVVAAETNATISSAVGGAGFTKTGGGILTLAASNSFGGLTLQAGTVRVGDNAALGDPAQTVAVDSNALLDINGVGAGFDRDLRAYTFTLNGGKLANYGAWCYAGVRRIVLTADSVVGGSGRFDVSRDIDELAIVGNGHRLTKEDGSEFSILGPSTGVTELVINQGLVRLESDHAAGDASIYVHPDGVLDYWNNATYSNAIVLAGTNTRVIVEEGEPTQHGTITSDTDDSIVYVDGGAMYNVEAVIVGSKGIVKTGDGGMVLRGANTYGGGTTVKAGFIRLPADRFGAVPAAPAVNVTLDGGALHNENSMTVIHSNRIVLLGPSGGYLTAGWDNGANGLEIAGPITGSGQLNVNRDGAPTILSHQGNDYSGDTVVGTSGPAHWDGATRGLLRLGADEVIPHGAGKGNLSFTPRGTLDLNGHTETVNGLSGNGVIENFSGAPGALTVLNDAVANSFYGIVRSSGGGSVALGWTGTNTFTFGGGGSYALGMALGAGQRMKLPASAGSGLLTLNGGTLVLGSTPGLLAGVLDWVGNLHLSRPNPGNSGVQLSPQMLNSVYALGGNTMYIYSGRMFVPGASPVTWTFAENMDDDCSLRIDGAVHLNDTGWDIPTKTNIALSPGWHDIEIRGRNGAGGGGPSGQNWLTLGFGFVYDTQGRDSTAAGDYAMPVDPADGTLFQTYPTQVVQNAVNLASDSTVEVEAGNVGVFHGALAGGAALAKNAPGTLALACVNTSTAPMTVHQGKLQLASVPGSGTITLDGGSLLVQGLPGLRSGMLIGGFDNTTPNPGNLGLASTTVMMNEVGDWGDNHEYLYSGAFFVPGTSTVQWTFAENVDDIFAMTVDGGVVLNDGTWDNPTKTNLTLTPGWHDFEVRAQNGGGGSGPSNGGWLTGDKGFVYDPLGRDDTDPAHYQALVDPGDGSLLRTCGNLTLANGVAAAGVGEVEVAETYVATLGGVVSGDSLRKTGNGRLVLNGASTLTGKVFAAAGILAVGASGSIDAGSGVHIESGAVLDLSGASGFQFEAGQTLSGYGTVRGPAAFASGSTLSPGGSAGTLSFDDSLTLLPGSTFSVEIGGTEGGVDFDDIYVGSAASLGGTLDVAFINGYTGSDGDTFYVIHAAVLDGTFAATNLPALGGGNVWNVQYLADAVVLSISSSPSPSGYDLYALSITNPAQRGYQDDPEGDGYPNLLEYATGGDAALADAAAAMGGGLGTGVLSLAFSRNTNAVDATLIVEGSYSAADGADWSGIATNANGSWGAAPNVTETGAGSPVNVKAWDTAVSPTNRFLRLRVTRP